jgi:cellulose synthase/poly-beta-1,6-N-acetylglucosamine synthase-like glycosyltransferase
MERARASLTQPTELHILDGADGKAAALNRALATLLPASEASVYVTLDDDIIPPPGWQDRLVSAFDADPKCGALGLWLGEPHRAYMGLSPRDAPQTRGDVALIPTDNNLVGCLIAFRREVALRVGPLPEGAEKYPYWEDGWRCRRVRSLDYTLAYLYDPGSVPELVTYPDPPAYLEQKAADIAAARPNVAHYLKSAGREPLSVHWRRFLRRFL